MSDAPETTGPVPPADLEPAPGLARRVAFYGGAMLLSCLLVTIGLRLWDRDLRAPFYYDLDALLYLPLVKTTLEHGSHWRNPRMGYPGEQHLDEFPIIDHLHFTILRFLHLFFSDLLVVYNVYNLLTYPLTVLTAMLAMRWLRLSLPAAAVGGLLYAFLPYHQERYQYHYFLAAYWMVPLSLLPALFLCKGEFPFFPKDANGQRRPRLLSRGALGLVLLGVATASAGAYYAFFACAAYGFAGLYASIIFRSWRGLTSAALLLAPVVFTGFAYHLPTFVYQAKYEVNPVTRRYPEEAESYGLKLAHLLLPANDHNLRPFNRVRTQYSTPMRPADWESPGSLGVIGGTGLVGLLTLALLPYRRRWPEAPLGAMTLFLVLLATVGGIGAIFNLLVTPQIRAYNRVGVYLGFMCLFIVLWWTDRFLLTRTGHRARQARYPVLGLMLVLGYADQTPWSWSPFNPHGMIAVEKHAQRFRTDRAFFQKIEAHMDPGSKIFCLPYAMFPESGAVWKMPAYEHARGYVFTDTLVWSYGTMKGREVDAWQRDVAETRPDEAMIRRIIAAGFDGVVIDGRGYPARGADRAAELINNINRDYKRLAGPTARLPQIDHDDGKQFFVDLRPFREAWVSRHWISLAAMEQYEREWVATLWLNGFYTSESLEDGETYHWGPPSATIMFVNPADRPRKFRISFVIGVDVYGPFHVTMSGLVDASFELDKVPGKSEDDWLKLGTPAAFVIELPPGRSTIRVRCKKPDHFLPADTRQLCYFIKNFKLEEVK